MSAYNNNFIKKSVSVPALQDYTLVHEQAREKIQGGAPNEHYHLSKTELANVQSIPTINAQVLANANRIAIYEPITCQGEMLWSSNGDIMVARGG